MSLAYQCTLAQVLQDKWSKRIRCLKSLTPDVDKLKVFYLNPLKNIKQREHMLEQFRKSNLDNITRVEPAPFPKLATGDEKAKLLMWSHHKMWLKAIDEGCDGALFFEDDINFIHNFKQYLQQILTNETDLYVMRFDSLPLITIKDLNIDEIVSYRSFAFACTGGYYLSRSALGHALYLVNKKGFHWETIENLLKELDTPKTWSFGSTPRLCIQNWFVQTNSQIQTNHHMQNLVDAQFSGYMQLYHHRYHFDKQETAEVEKLLHKYEKTPSKVIVKHLTL